jgi:hypothetical protein
MLEGLSEFLSAFVLPIIVFFVGEESALGSLLSGYPLLLLVFVFLPLLIFGFVALFFDFIKDSWKMPIGIVADVLVLFFFTTLPGVLIFLAFPVAIVYFLLGKGEVQRRVYAGAVFLRFLLLAPFIPLPEGFKAFLVLVPICTIAMFLLCVTD